MKYFLSLLFLMSAQLVFADATDPSNFKVKEGFKVELLYTVPNKDQGSWVAMTVDPKGRLIVSDQYGSLYRIDVSGKAKVEKIDLDIGSAQGLLYAFDGLYVMVNGHKTLGKGVFKVTDKDGDDKYDTITELLKFEKRGGEHGPHALVLSPDGKSIHMVVGNQSALPEYQSTRVPPLWGEDQLLPRIYGKGFMKGTEAPKGFIAKCSPDFKNIEIVATGFRNQYDAAFNREGELFTYDADMEWDINTPWYRPTRINHVVSGAEFGWRNGSAKFMNYYPDNLPTTLDIGPGSPTGVSFGYGAAFPRKYQDALFICDWSYGILYAVHLTADGATYKGVKEQFITGQPLPLTDLLVHPKDKALYFTTGGRKVQSALYKVTYTGKTTGESTKPGLLTAEARIRKDLEMLHHPGSKEAVNIAWPYLSHKDRHIRWAARTAIEHQPSNKWCVKALSEENTQAALEALVALARAKEKTSSGPAIINKLLKMDWQGLSESQQLTYLRVLHLTIVRKGGVSEAQKQALLTYLDSKYPVLSDDLNKELCQTLVYLGSESVVSKSVDLLEKAPSQEMQIHYAKSIRMATKGWSKESYKKLFHWFALSESYGGGASFKLFMKDIKNDVMKRLSAADKKNMAAIINQKVDVKTRMNPALMMMAKRGFMKPWKMSDFNDVINKALKGRDFEKGKNFFGAANCTSCHRIGEYGGVIGPDLTGAGGRFTAKDLLEAIIEPSKQISDQYSSLNFTLKDGSTLNGRIANLKEDHYRIITDLNNPGSMTHIKVKDIKKMEPAKVSMMPPGLLNMMKQDEILDLLAYILSRGDKKHGMFK